METPADILLLPQLLGSDALRQIEFLLQHAQFTDGRVTATAAAQAVKQNLQIDLQDQQVLPTLRHLLADALQKRLDFHSVCYPLQLYPFLVSKYEPGMRYGWHTDSPVMGHPPVRTDLAMTIFLNDPENYDGGELRIRYLEDRFADFKLPAGHAVIYPCHYVHCVNEVTRGARLVAVTWVQSIIRSAEQRHILYSLKNLYEQIHANADMSEQAAALQQTWSNLFRMWADL